MISKCVITIWKKSYRILSILSIDIDLERLKPVTDKNYFQKSIFKSTTLHCFAIKMSICHIDRRTFQYGLVVYFSTLFPVSDPFRFNYFSFSKLSFALADRVTAVVVFVSFKTNGTTDATRFSFDGITGWCFTVMARK